MGRLGRPSGLRGTESSLLGPSETDGLMADLGADVIKVEPAGATTEGGRHGDRLDAGYDDDKVTTLRQKGAVQ
jgi:crotonobetainyl-CoA:carnitine CoA-transferase CaiB-like acyl-CoA transferase